MKRDPFDDLERLTFDELASPDPALAVDIEIVPDHPSEDELDAQRALRERVRNTRPLAAPEDRTLPAASGTRVAPSPWERFKAWLGLGWKP